MKQWMKKLFLIVLCLHLLPATQVFAREKESLEQFADTDALWQSIPEELNSDALRSLLNKEDAGDFSKGIWDSILSLFSLGMGEGVRLFARICILLLFAALMRALKDSFGFLGGDAFDFLFLLSLSLICFSSLQDCITLANASLSSIKTFFLTSLPVTTVLLTLSGSPTAAGTMASSLNLTIGAVSTAVSAFLSPLLNTLFVFSAVDGILDGCLKGFLAFLKKTVKVLCIFFFTLVTFSLGLQNALATAADSVAMRSVRFAAGNFIPIVGSLVGESAKTLSAAFSTVKAECGILCIFVLVFVLLRPILCIVVQKLFLGFAGAFAEMVGEDRIRTFLQTLSGLLDLLMALLISQGCYLIFYITLFLVNRGGF